jgi:hypothetical protein
VSAYRKDDSFLRLLETLPRCAAPEIPVEGLFRRLAWRRARLGALVLVAVAGPLLLALLLLREKPEPPVNLKLRIVELGEPLDQPSRDPPELNLP